MSVKRTLVFGAFNNVFFAAMGGVLAFAQLLLAMHFLDGRDMGQFAVAAVFAVTLEFLSDFGIGDRLVQQDDIRLRRAFHTAATAQLMAAAPLWAVVFVSAPLVGSFYGLPALPGLVRLMSFQAFGGVLRLPLFLLVRDFRFFRHRLLLFAGKATSFLVTVSLAALGFGAWSLAYGTIAGLLATAIPAWYSCPIRVAWRWNTDEIRSLLALSWPVWLSRVALIGVEQGSVLVVSVYLSVSELGQYKSAEQLAHFAILIEVIFAQTIYPALCRYRDDMARFSNIVAKTGRAAMVFLAPGGFALLVFPGQIVHLLLTPRWEGAELFLQAHGAGLLLGAIAFNWETVFRAVGNTQPVFRFAVIYALSFVCLFSPLAYAFGRRGVAAGVILVNIVAFIVRDYYFRKLRLRTSIVHMLWRSFLAGMAGVAGVFILRSAVGEAATFAAWFVELFVYLAICASMLISLERHLIRELREIIASRNVNATAA